MQLVGLLIPADFEVSAFAALSVFEAANAVLGEERYITRVLSEEGGSIGGAFGVEMTTHAIAAPEFDTLLVAGAGTVTATSPRVIAFLRQAAHASRRVAAIRLGTFALAEAGLLDGRRATTHWAFADELKQGFPKVIVEDDSIFVEHGAIWTSAGMSASVDLAMALIERDIGADAARAVASQLVIGQRRYGRQQQRPETIALEPKSDRVQMALAHARANLRAPLTVEELADAAHLSPRQFSRVFSEETGFSPARAVEKLRLDAARLLVSQGRLAIDLIARETGFGDPERMRRAFQRAFGQSPREVRHAANPQVGF